MVGDVILLEAGDMVPADGRLIENASLKINESALTGESLAVEKSISAISEDVPLGDRTNMLFSGSFVTYGRGKRMVTDIGMETEVGRIAGLLKSTSEKQTPLQANLEEFGKKLSVLILVFCGILFAINVFRGENIGSAFMFAWRLQLRQSRKPQLDCDNRTFFWDTENGEGARDNPQAPGGGRTGQRICNMFGQNRNLDAEQNDSGRLLRGGEENSGSRNRCGRSGTAMSDGLQHSV